MFPNFASFDECMKACTKDYECMVLDQTSLSYNISDCVKFYKATPDLKYRLGAPEYWRFSEKRGRKPALEEEEEDNSSDSDDPKPKSRMRIKKRYPK